MTLPLMMLLLMGIVDLGRIYYSYITITNAARVGARYGAANPTNVANIIARTKAEANGIGIDPAQLSVAVTCEGPGGTCVDDYAIRVTTSYPFQLITTYLFGGGTIGLSTFNEMQIFGN